MRNIHIKYCDLYHISDGLVREMLYKGHTKQSISAINSSIKKRQNEIEALRSLKETLIWELKEPK